MASLIANFEDIKQKAFELKAGLAINSVSKGENPGKVESEKLNVTEAVVNEYEKVLDSMIAAEVGNFDRALLRNEGYERAKANNGDQKVLRKGLDTVYSVFINEIDVIEDKKRRLLAKIDEQQVKSVNSIKQKLELQLATSKGEYEVNKMNLNNRIINNKAQILIKEQRKKEGIKSITLPALEKQIEEVKNKIKDNQVDFVKPAFKWFEFIPTLIINLGLFAYLVLFYSSACYILLFGALDAEEADRQRASITPPEIFNAHAISKAWDQGGSAPFFILVFIFLPVAFALAGRFIKNQVWANFISFGFGIIIIDGAIAYQVAKTIHYINKMKGDVTEPWHASQVFQETNFYLVFVLGALGLLLFKFTYNKFIEIFEKKS